LGRGPFCGGNKDTYGMAATRRTIPEKTLRTVSLALRNQQVVNFVQTSVQSGYFEIFPEALERIRVQNLLDEAFEKLTLSQQGGVNPGKLSEVTYSLAGKTFRKGDSTFWFNQRYHVYKTRTKSEGDFQQLKLLIQGNSILDYGCGSGYLAARFERDGYKVFTTDVLDYRYEEARHLPFARMNSATGVPFPNDTADTALVHAVLHHIGPDELPAILRGLAGMARHLLIEEDTYDLPAGLEGLDEKLATQPLLRSFVRMPCHAQYQALVLIDYFSNAIAQGIPEMNMPFEFKTVGEWQRILEMSGFKVVRALVMGFKPDRMHKSCHILILCDRANRTVSS
jgi:SAM-dependent methyltransferase